MTSDPRRWRSLPIILAATFMALFDVFVVNVSAPSIQRDLHASSGGLELVLAAYSFTYAIGLVTGGRLGDLFGRRRLFAIGMAIFTAASLLCGLAPTIGMLIGGRLLQGAGAAAMTPQVLALITVGFPAEERTRAFAFFGATVGLGTVAGQILGGALLQLNIAGLGWRPIFFINVPVGIAAVIGAVRLVRESRAPAGERIDPLGLVTLTAGLAALVVPLVLGRNAGWPLWTWVSLAGSVALLSVFAWWERVLERRGGSPLLRPELLRVPAMVNGIAITAAYYCFFGGFLLVFTLFLQNGLHDTPLQAGLTLAPLGVAFASSSLAGRRLAARFGAISMVTLGTVLSGLGLLVLAVSVNTAGVGVATLPLRASLVLTGIGNGLVIPLLLGAVMTAVPSRMTGAASGVLTSTAQLSISLGVALIGLLFFQRVPSSGIGAATAESLFCDLGLVVVASAMSFTLSRLRREPLLEGPALQEAA